MSGYAVSYHEGTNIIRGCYSVDSKSDVPSDWKFVKDYPGEAMELPNNSVENARLLAYADPLKGSDRYVFEAITEREVGNEDAAVIALAKSLERKEQIKKENPWA